MYRHLYLCCCILKSHRFCLPADPLRAVERLARLKSPIGGSRTSQASSGVRTNLQDVRKRLPIVRKHFLGVHERPDTI